jgi:hypothetical protein
MALFPVDDARTAYERQYQTDIEFEQAAFNLFKEQVASIKTIEGIHAGKQGGRARSLYHPPGNARGKGTGKCGGTRRGPFRLAFLGSAVAPPRTGCGWHAGGGFGGGREGDEERRGEGRESGKRTVTRAPLVCRSRLPSAPFMNGPTAWAGSCRPSRSF